VNDDTFAEFERLRSALASQNDGQQFELDGLRVYLSLGRSSLQENMLLRVHVRREHLAISWYGYLFWG
jgi:hypothetical protein